MKVGQRSNKHDLLGDFMIMLEILFTDTGLKRFNVDGFEGVESLKS